MVEGLHIMQTIRQFDQKHADIRGHRDQKFSKVLRMLSPLRQGFDDMRKLCNAINQKATSFPNKVVSSSEVPKVSSTVSCNSPVTTVAVSILTPAKIRASAKGCVK